MEPVFIVDGYIECVTVDNLSAMINANSIILIEGSKNSPSTKIYLTEGIVVTTQNSYIGICKALGRYRNDLLSGSSNKK